MRNADGQPRPIIVVGAGGGGIGTAITARLIAQGIPVIAVDQNASHLEALPSLLSAPLLSATQLSAPLHSTPSLSADSISLLTPEIADATDSASIEDLFGRIEAAHPDLGGLVNVIGGLPFPRWRAITEDDDENLDALLDTNLRAAVRTSRAFARIQKKRVTVGALPDEDDKTTSVVQIATIAALEGMPYGAGYAASKAALLSYTRTMALEWGAYGIRANAVAPGSIRVPKNQNDHAPERDARVLPLRRRGTPGDVADAAVFLLSDAASWITGQVLAVDGGASIKPSYLDEENLPVFVQDPELRRRLLRGEDETSD